MPEMSLSAENGERSRLIIGVDEVNFSPSLAGDCVVCAFLKKPQKIKIAGVHDSKQISHEKQVRLFEKLQYNGWYQIQLAAVNEIDQLGIYLARNRAIRQAVRNILSKVQPFYYTSKFRVIIDGRFGKLFTDGIVVDSDVKVETMLKADEQIYEVSAASIIARVYADALFQGFGTFYPGYNLEKCHGSPDKTMYEMLRKNGPTPYHRTAGYARSWWAKIMGKEKK